MLAHGIHDEDLVVSMPHLTGRIDEVSSIRVPEGRPVHVTIVRDLVLSFDPDDVTVRVEKEIGDEELKIIVVVSIGPVADPLPIGRKERTTVVSRSGDERHILAGLQVTNEEIALPGGKRAVEEIATIGGDRALGHV